MDVDRLLLVLMIKKIFPIYFAKIEPFFVFQTKNNLSTSLYIFSTILQILKIKFYVFWTQTRRKLKPIKLANFSSITCP